MKVRKSAKFLIAILVSLHTPIYAQTDGSRQFSENHGIQVSKALRAINTGDYQTALSILDKTLEQHPDLNPYEKSTVFQIKGSSHYELGQTVEAVQAFEGAINAGGLSSRESNQLCVNIAQLRIGNGEYKRGTKLLEKCLKDEGRWDPNSELVASMCSKLKSYECALPWAERWFEDANPKERKHYDVLNSIYGELKMSEKQIKIIKEMMDRWPNDRSLSESYFELNANNGQDREVSSDKP